MITISSFWGCSMVFVTLRWPRPITAISLGAINAIFLKKLWILPRYGEIVQIWKLVRYPYIIVSKRSFKSTRHVEETNKLLTSILIRWEKHWLGEKFTSVLSKSLLRIKRMNESIKNVCPPSLVSITTNNMMIWTYFVITSNMTLNLINSWKIAMKLLKRSRSQNTD